MLAWNAPPGAIFSNMQGVTGTAGMSSRGDPSTLSTQRAAGLAPPLNAFGSTGVLRGYPQAAAGMGGSGLGQAGSPWADIGYAYSRTVEPYSFSLEDYAILGAMRRMGEYTKLSWWMSRKSSITFNQNTGYGYTSTTTTTKRTTT